MNQEYLDLLRRVEQLEKLVAQPRTDDDHRRQPFHERMPDMDELVKVRADLFDNKIASKGNTQYKLKLFCWVDDNDAPRGTMQPLFYNMYRPEKFRPKPYSYADEVWRDLQHDMDVLLIGYLVHQGAKFKGFKGRKVMADHVAVMRCDRTLSLLTLRAGNRQQLDFDPANPIQDGADDHAFMRWYWNAE